MISTKVVACIFALLCGGAAAKAQVASAGGGASAGSVATNCSVLVNSGGSIATGITNTPSGGTLCIGTGSFSVGGGNTLSSTITITGYPLQPLCQASASLGATCPGMPGGAIPTYMPALTETSAALMFSINANNITIEGLSATGNTPNTNTGACTGAEFAIPQSGKSGANIRQNYITNFTCGIEGLTSGSPFAADSNYLLNNTYVGLGCSACTGGGSIWTGNVAFQIGQNTGGTTNAGGNDYPFVLSYSGSTQSTGFTVQYNTAINSRIWECFDNHDGTNLTWQNNLCVGAGTTTSASDNHNAVSNGINGVQVKNNVIDQGSNGTLHDAIDMCALSTCTGSSGVSGSNAISGNTIRFGAGNGCLITNTSAVTPSNNNGATPCNSGNGLAVETVSSITLTSFTDGTNNQYIHGQPNHTIATISVNMSAASWAWPQPPGTLTITGVNSCGLQVVGQQLVQSNGGSPAGTCNDFSIVATLGGMSGSPFTQGGFSIAGT